MSRHNIDEQLTLDAALWKAWSDNGVRDGTTLTVDFTFYASKANRAEALVEALKARGYQVELRSERTFLLFKGWVVEAHINGPWSLSRLQQAGREFCELADQHSALYDGAGAEMP